MKLWPGRGDRARCPHVANKAISARSQVGIGKWDADGAPDTLVPPGRQAHLVLRQRTRRTTSARVVPGIKLRPYDWIIGISTSSSPGTRTWWSRKSGRIYLLPGSTTGVGAPVPARCGGKAFDLAG